jgi:hypothetical protein
MAISPVTTASKLHKTLCLAIALVKFQKNELNTQNISGDLNSKAPRITKCITCWIIEYLYR